MQRAAAAVAASASDLLLSQSGGRYGRHVMIMVGAGNNGGDALFAGVRLARPGLASPQSAAWAPTCGRPCGVARAGGRWSTSMIMIRPSAGVRPGHRRHPRHRRPSRTAGPRCPPCAIRGGAGIPTIAVDLLGSCPTPAPLLERRCATRTVTFGERKPCHLLQPALSRCGAITVVDIGLGTDHDETADLVGLDEDGLAAAWPYPTERSDKYARGVVGVDTGSDQYPGAAVMSVYGAVYGGRATSDSSAPSDRPPPSRRSCRTSCFRPGGSRPISSAPGGATVPMAPRSSPGGRGGLPAVVDADGLGYLPKPAPPAGC